MGKPHIYWSRTLGCWRCYVPGVFSARSGHGHTAPQAYHNFMLANSFKLKEDRK